ncbi:MAG TPA: hypothetical protein VI504_00980 [Candidatus Eisenbacteria bacterium]|jgi:hypothetical protein
MRTPGIAPVLTHPLRPLLRTPSRLLARGAWLATLIVTLAATAHAHGARGFAGGFHGGRGFAGAHTFVGARPFVGGPHVFVRNGFHGGFTGGPVFRHCYRPRTFVRFGFDVGFPRYYHYYQPPVVVYERDAEPDHVAPAPVGPVSDDDFDVTNLPPLGCYYYDHFCNQRFATLDDYTEHLQHHHHAGTIAIIDKKSGDRLRTLEFVNGEWRPEPI